MGDKALQLEITTPEQILLRTQVEAVIAPGALGYLGVLPKHAPLLTSLEPGVMRYREQGRLVRLAVSGGFMEVAPNRIVVLADTAEPAEEIDVERARRAKERAEKRLQERPAGLDVARAEAALKRALARLKAAQAS